MNIDFDNEKNVTSQSINIDDFPIEINNDFLLIAIDCYQFLLIDNYQ